MFKQDQDIFNVLLGAVSEGVIIIDEKQNIVEVNQSVLKMFGYRKGELMKKPLNILIPRNYHADHGKHVKGFMKKQTRRRMGQGRDIFGARKDGTTFPVEAGLNPFTIYEKNYVMALIIDITIRKAAEQDLKHWAKIFNQSLNEIYIFSGGDLKFLNVNSGALSNMGYSLEEFKKMTPSDIKPEYTKKQFKSILQPLLNGIEEKLVFETIHQRKDGTTYPVEVHLQLSNVGNQQVLVAIILDITVRKNYTDELENTVEQRTKELQSALEKEKELNDLKTKFLSMVSHEFKTPLSGILTSSMLLGKYKQAGQQEKRDKHIKTIVDKVHYLNNILNDFLSVEKLQDGKIKYTPHKFKLSKVVNEVVYNANMLLKEGQKINYPENIDAISMNQDEKIVELALSNLVNNAIKYSPENTIIGLEIIQDKQKTTFKVKDQGIGIPKKDQKNIFNRYFRAENALLTQGTGIGLNIVQDHLENLDGCIYFESSKGKGSVFTIEIPNSYKD